MSFMKLLLRNLAEPICVELLAVQSIFFSFHRHFTAASEIYALTEIPTGGEIRWRKTILKIAEKAAFKPAEFRQLERFSKTPDVMFLRAFKLLKSAGLTDVDACKTIRQYPRILQTCSEKSDEKIKVLQRVMGLTPKELQKAVSTYPAILAKSENFIQNLGNKFAAMGLDAKQAKHVFCQFPIIAGLDMDKKLRDLRDLFCKEYEAHEIDFFKMVTSQARMLGHSTENIARKLQYFESLGLTKAEVGGLIRRGACLFGFNIETGYKTRVAWFKTAGFSDENLAKIILREPEALIYSLNKLQKDYDLLKKWKLTDDEIHTLYVKHSRTIGLNFASALQQAKFKFFRKVCGLDNRTILVRYPAIIYLSLTTRLLVRQDYLASLGHKDFRVTYFRETDQTFCRRYANKPLEHYTKFYDRWQQTRGREILQEIKYQSSRVRSLS